MLKSANSTPGKSQKLATSGKKKAEGSDGSERGSGFSIVAIGKNSRPLASRMTARASSTDLVAMSVPRSASACWLREFQGRPYGKAPDRTGGGPPGNLRTAENDEHGKPAWKPSHSPLFAASRCSPKGEAAKRSVLSRAQSGETCEARRPLESASTQMADPRPDSATPPKWCRNAK